VERQRLSDVNGMERLVIWLDVFQKRMSTPTSRCDRPSPNQSRPQLPDTLGSAVEGDPRVNEPVLVNHLPTKAV
jgi:hypothetical protein